MTGVLSRALSGFVVLGLSGGLASSISLVLIPLYTRVLTVEEYGVLGILNLTLTFTMFVFSCGIGPALFRSYHDYETEAERATVTLTATGCLVLQALALICVVVFIGWIATALGFDKYTRYGREFLINALATTVFMIYTIPFTLLRIAERYKFLSGANLALAVLTLGLILFFFIVLDLRLLGIVLGRALAGAAIIGFLVWSVRQAFNGRVDLNVARRLYHYGFPFIAADSALIILTSGGIYYLGMIGTAYEVGLYALVNNFVMIMQILVVRPFMTVWLPVLFALAKTPDRGQIIRARAPVYLLYLMLGITLFVTLFSDHLVSLLAGSSYAGAAPLLGLVLAGQAVFAVQVIFMYEILLQRRTGVIGLIYSIQAVATAVISLATYPLMGIMAVVLAPTLCFLIGALIAMRLSRAEVDYEWRRMGIVSGIFAAACAVSWSLPSLGTGPELALNSLLMVVFGLSPILIPGLLASDERRFLFDRVQGTMQAIRRYIARY